MVQCDLVQSVLVQCGLVKCNLVQFFLVQCDLVQCDLVQCDVFLPSSPVMVKMPTSQLMPLFPSRAMSIPVAAHSLCFRLDLKEAQIPVQRTSR